MARIGAHEMIAHYLLMEPGHPEAYAAGVTAEAIGDPTRTNFVISAVVKEQLDKICSSDSYRGGLTGKELRVFLSSNPGVVGGIDDSNTRSWLVIVNATERTSRGQTKTQAAIDRKQKVERAESQPGLAANIDHVAELKIASRKSVFHLGEMMTLDVALLNRSARPVFFRKLSELSIVVLSSTGQSLPIQEDGAA